MKKILSVSILAMLAVAPLAARAGEGDAQEQGSGTTTTITFPVAHAQTSTGDNERVITAGYVKGAYDAAIDAINAENTRATTAEGAINTKIGTQGSGNHSTLYTGGANETIHESLEALETAIDGLGTTAGSTYQTKTDSNVTAEKKTAANYTNVSDSKLTNGTGVADNLIALDKAIIANETKIGATNLANTGTLSGNNTDLSTAVNALNAEIGATDMGTTQTTLTAAIAELNGDVGTTGSVSKKIKDNAESATFTAPNGATNFVTGSANAADDDNTINKAVNRLDAKMGVLTGLSNDAGMTNAKGSVVSAINAVAATVEANKTASTVADGTYVNANNNVAQNLTALDTQVKANTDKIGSATMTTTADTLTGAINELDGDVGDKSNLTVSAGSRTNLVSAINEVNSKVLTVYSDWASGGTAGGANTVALNPTTSQ